MSRKLLPLCAVVALAVYAAPANAAIEIERFSTSTSTTQAGGHPDLTTEFALGYDPAHPEAAKTVIFNAPVGVFGNPKAIARCTADDFALDQCPVNSQAGLITVRAKLGSDTSKMLGTAPLFDMEPQAGETARFAFVAPIVGIPISIPVQVRTAGDFGLRFTVSEITQAIPLREVKIVFWGSPASSAHDAERFPKGAPGEPAGCPELSGPSCITELTAASVSVKPLISNPTQCTSTPLRTTLDVASYQDANAFGHAESSYPATTGCEHLTFKPVLDASLTTDEADSASGVNLDFKVPQVLGTTPSPSQARAVTVRFPAGLTINPDAADGQRACSDAEAEFGTEGPARCPDNAKIGTVAINSPALDGPLEGSIYIGEPKPGNQYRLFLIASGFGLNVKLVGSFQPDPQTGQLVGEFRNLPQAPFEEFNLHLFASDRGLMATPTGCTIYQLSATFDPWDEALASQTSERSVSIARGPNGAACPGVIRPFTPRLVAGASNPVAGAYSHFHLRLDRDDGDQFLGDLNFRMPPGFTGKLSGIGYCPEQQIVAATTNSGRAEQAQPSCPSSSFIGTTNVAAGPGEHPFHAVGRMYLAGPLQGAPLSLVAVTPALAGPYDYGVVVVRVALHVDPFTAQVTAVSEKVPAIIGGIPIRMRSIQVNIDRENFTINPTNCSHFSVDSEGIGDQGTIADFSSPFHAVNCRSLGFSPTMTVRQLGSRKQTHRAADPRLQLDLRTKSGDANLKAISVTLPNSLLIDQRHLGGLCVKSELETRHCEDGQPMGRVWVKTPLLDRPLTGFAYAVSGYGGLPHVAFILDGQVALTPVGESETVKGDRLKTTVPVVPDAPIGHFRLTLFGGKHGYLRANRDLCQNPGVVDIEYIGQNGKVRKQRVKPKEPCGKHRRHKRR